MAARNRVVPDGSIAAIDLRGRWMGNRGCLHRGTEIVRPWRSRAWITCETSFRGRSVEQWAPGRYTVLFFHDEAVALAAGHRPCAECRRPAYRDFLDAWQTAHGPRPRAAELDRALHAARLQGRDQRVDEHPWTGLPDGTFVAAGSTGAALVLGDTLVPWSVDGYRAPAPRPTGGVAAVLTPAPTVAVLRAGYQPQVDIA